MKALLWWPLWMLWKAATTIGSWGYQFSETAWTWYWRVKYGEKS